MKKDKEALAECSVKDLKKRALDAKADDLETLGFISIITILPFLGMIAN